MYSLPVVHLSEGSVWAIHVTALVPYVLSVNVPDVSLCHHDTYSAELQMLKHHADLLHCSLGIAEQVCYLLWLSAMAVCKRYIDLSEPLIHEMLCKLCKAFSSSLWLGPVSYRQSFLLC